MPKPNDPAPKESSEHWQAYLGPPMTTEADILKKNFLAEIEFHNKHCDSTHCKVQIWLLFRLAERAGLSFTQEEKYSK